MVCNKCFNPGVKNEVLGKEFYYCRTCKDEIGLTATPAAVTATATSLLEKYGRSIALTPPQVYGNAYAGYFEIDMNGNVQAVDAVTFRSSSPALAGGPGGGLSGSGTYTVTWEEN